MKNTFVFGDPRKCIGCGACEVACAMAHLDKDIDGDVRKAKEFHPRVTIVRTPDVTIPIQCRQCEDAPCANSCPEEAIIRRNGAVEIVAGKCVGCKSCVVACPFGAIQVVESTQSASEQKLQVMDGEEAHHKAIFAALKCDLCQSREGGPACVDICPAGALNVMTPENMQELVTNRRLAVVNGLQ